MPTLSWLTREKDVKCADGVAYRLLERDDELSVGSPDFGNMLIQGDNLQALKSLLPYYRGQVKCIYIDPPYNTRSAFEHYDDNLEHSQWLAMIWPRLVLLRELLAEDGSIWVSIDDNEGHYLKVIMDEVFGRRNFIASNVWQKRYSRENREAIGDVHEYLTVYAKSPEAFKAARNRIPLDEQQAKIYKNPGNSKETDPTKRWRGLPMTAQGFRPNQMYIITAPNGTQHRPPEGRCWSMVEPEFEKFKARNRIYWGKDGNAQPSVIRYLSEVEGLVPWTWWPHTEVGHTDESKKECNELFGASVSFGTPKPERLLQRVLHIATNPGDLVLDSFLGSGTTAAVAHKMGRRWIGIEMGDHAQSHCAPRLRKVIDGEQGGISKSVDWQGGGGFAYYRLGEAVFDGNGAINPGIAFAPLAAHIWFSETGLPFAGKADTPFIGEHDGGGLALLYNGILGDKRVSGGNVLTRKTLATVRAAASGFSGPITVYGEASRLSPESLRAEGITFKQTPYDVKAR
ncbi:site-specific DNA-methyltransferase [Sphingobium sp. TomTYG75]